MKLFKSKIDKLADKVSSLVIKRQNVEDKMHEKNSTIETKLKKLENKSFRNKQLADKKVAEIDRLTEKTNEDIKTLQKYYASINVGKTTSKSKV